MRFLHYTLFIALLHLTVTTSAQAQVSEEPFHRPVIRNKYFRLLNVWLKPGDTTQFHIHSTPSAFLHYTKAMTGSQVKGGAWIHEVSDPGKSWFRSFAGDTLIHRVCNADTVPFHVTDMEILSVYQPEKEYKTFPLEMLYQNDTIAAYRGDRSSLSGELITERGPLLIQLVEGELAYENLPTGEKRTLKTGEQLYIQPGTFFSLRPAGKGNINVFFFEIK